MYGTDLTDMPQLCYNETVMGLNWWWLRLFFYFLDIGIKNIVLLYILSIYNEYRDIDRSKLILVSTILGNQIKYVPISPNEVILHLVHICMNNIDGILCAYIALFSNKNRTWYKWKYTKFNMPLCSARCCNGSVMIHDCFDLSHHTS